VKLKYLNTAKLMRPHAHGSSPKSLIVLHETVSPDAAGWSDINGVEAYLAGKDYGIHGMTDAEGHVAWALGLGRAVFWQAGGVNSESIGFEQVSRVMLQSPSNKVRKAIWLARDKQLRATAKGVACAARAQGIPIRYSDSRTPGITSHWDVSQFHAESEGHTDCWPVHKGGYYPILYVIGLAKVYYAAGYSF
jgi:hypothetical protein